MHPSSRLSIKTKVFLIYRSTRYHVTSLTRQLFQHDASVKSPYKLKYIFNSNLFACSRSSSGKLYFNKDMQQKQTPTLHASTVNRTDRSSHKRGKKSEILLKGRPDLVYQTFVVGVACQVLQEKDTCLHTLLLLFFSTGEELQQQGAACCFKRVKT